jgi:hypothetical protein
MVKLSEAIANISEKEFPGIKTSGATHIESPMDGAIHPEVYVNIRNGEKMEGLVYIILLRDTYDFWIKSKLKNYFSEGRLICKYGSMCIVGPEGSKDASEPPAWFDSVLKLYTPKAGDKVTYPEF